MSEDMNATIANFTFNTHMLCRKTNQALGSLLPTAKYYSVIYYSKNYMKGYKIYEMKNKYN